MIKKALLLWCVFASAYFCKAQEIVIPFQGDTIVFASHGTVKTHTIVSNVNGGLIAHYLDNNDGRLTIYPDAGCRVHLSGTYNTEYYLHTNGTRYQDPITVYDGADTTAPILSQVAGDGYLELTSTQGPLTIRFQSNGAVFFNGCDFAISSVAGCTCENAYEILFDPIDDALNVTWIASVGQHAQSYTLEYGPAGFTPGNGTIVHCNTNTYLVHNLLDDHKYDFYVYYDGCDSTGIPAFGSYQTLKSEPCIVINSLVGNPNITCTYGNCSGTNIHYQCSDDYAYNIVNALDFGEANANSRHTIIRTDTRDPRTGNKLHTIMPGYSQSIRLGNWLTGSNQNTPPQAESITYEYLVDTIESPIVLLQYAAVMEDPVHATYEQPRFTLEILNEDGIPIDSTCGSADFVSDSTLGWNTYQYLTLSSAYYTHHTQPYYHPPHTIYWKDWTNVGIDLSNYHNQRVQIRLTTYDCKENAHYGYAYFNLDCKRKEIFSNVCGDNSAISYTAPSGFNYRWFFEDNETETLGTSQTIQLDGLSLDRNRIICCHCSFLGDSSCGFVLKCDMLPRWPIADFTATRDSCSTTFQFTNTSAISTDGITVSANSRPCERAHWDFGDGSTSDDYHPAPHTYEHPGWYTVTLISSINEGLCTDTLSQRIFAPGYQSTKDTLVCDFFEINGHIFTESCTFLDTLPAFDDCDSIITWNIRIAHSSNDTTIVVQNDPFSWYGTTYTHTGTFTYQDTTSTFCDSIHTLLLTINPIVYDTLTVCESALPFYWQPYNYWCHYNGNDTLHLTNVYGSDSTIILTINVTPTVILPPITYSIVENQLPYRWPIFGTWFYEEDTVFHPVRNGDCWDTIPLILFVYRNVENHLDTTICESELPFTWIGKTFYQEGYDTALLYTSHGADSLLHLDLHVWEAQTTIITDTVVENQLPHTFNNQTFDSCAVADFHFDDIHGCDSVVRYQLWVWYNDTIRKDTIVCESDLPFVWDGYSFTQATIDTAFLHNQHGADSIIIRTVNIIPREHFVYNLSITENQLPYQWLPYGNIFTQEGYIDTVWPNEDGCLDSVSLVLTVYPNTESFIDTAICENELPLIWHGKTFVQTGMDTLQLLTSNGADSIVHLSVQIWHNDTVYIFDTIVENQLPYTAQGLTFTGNANQDFLHETVHGCDSLVSYHLWVWPNDTLLEDTLICESALPYAWHGHLFTEAEVDTTFSLNQHGADSILIRTVSIIPRAHFVFEMAITENQLPFEWIPYGLSFTQAGRKDTVWPNEDDCLDSITLELTVYPNTAVFLDTAICENSLPLTWHGKSFEQAGSDTLHLLTENGADSIVHLSVQVWYNDTVDIFDTIVENQLPHVAQGQAFNGNAHLDFLYETAHGCDSLVHYHLLVYPNKRTTSDTAVCITQTPFEWNGLTFTASTMDSVIMLTSHGADSTIVMHVTVNPIPELQIQVERLSCDELNATLTAITADSNCNYVWNTGDTTPAISISTSGIYTITITDSNGCTNSLAENILQFHSPIVSTHIPNLCAGETAIIHVGYNAGSDIQLADERSTIGIADSIFIPDGYSCPPYGTYYRSNIQFSDFSPNAVIRNANDIMYVRIKMEHSALEDLRITLGCPNGSTSKIIPDYQNDGWGNVQHYFRLNMGIANRLQDHNSCDASLNPIGIPWNYVWSNHTTSGYQYAGGTHGYCYEPENVQHTYNPYWDDGTLSYKVDSSNVANMSQVYHPFQNFDNLTGCPLNGSWYIQIQDLWANDNGYLVEWELALSTDLLPPSQPPITHSSIEGPWISVVNDTTFLLSPPTLLEHDTTVSYTVTVFDSLGCSYDTTITARFYSNPIVNIHDTIVQNQLPYQYNGHTFPAGIPQLNAYTFNLQTQHGCDSTVHYQLFVWSNDTTQLTHTICAAELPFTWETLVFNAAGTQQHTLQNSHGADSTLVLTLVVNATSSDTLAEEIVENQLPHLFSGITFWNDVTDTLLEYSTVHGCDSTIRYSLQVHRNSQSVYDTAFCRNAMPITWHGITIPAAGTYTDTLLDRFGADSVIVLNITENPPYIENYEDVICEGSAYHNYGFDLSGAQTIGKAQMQLSHSYESIFGCDSIINLDLTIIDTNLLITSPTEDFCEDYNAELTASGNFTDYIWSTGETGTFITVSAPGIYAVTASDERCSATAYYTIEICEFNLFLPNAITPTNHDGLNDYLFIHESTAALIDDFEIRIFNRWGEEVFHSNDKHFKWYGEYKNQIYSNTIYNYIIRCTNLEGRQYLFKGSITVL